LNLIIANFSIWSNSKTAEASMTVVPSCWHVIFGTSYSNVTLTHALSVYYYCYTAQSWYWDGWPL